MTRDEILSEIRRLGMRRGGRLSFRAFQAATGIGEHQVVGVYWPTWNAAIAEAGLAPQRFAREAADESVVFEALAQLIERLGRWPTERELSVERRRDQSFPGLKVFRTRKGPEFLRGLVEHCADRADLATAAAVAAERFDALGASVAGAAPIAGYVYMMRSGRRYKIGHTTSPSRRHREVRLDLPDPTLLVHTIATDDPAGIEAYWHNRFLDKRVRDTEFFTLTAADVAAFKRRKSQ